jgi:hypothetical protein
VSIRYLPTDLVRVRIDTYPPQAGSNIPPEPRLTVDGREVLTRSITLAFVAGRLPSILVEFDVSRIELQMNDPFARKEPAA